MTHEVKTAPERPTEVEKFMNQPILTQCEADVAIRRHILHLESRLSEATEAIKRIEDYSRTDSGYGDYSKHVDEVLADYRRSQSQEKPNGVE